MATLSQRAPDIYASLLLSKGHGYPLWLPGPPSNLPNGTQIGDLGILNDDGGFTYLFNVCKDASDENRAPPGFEPLKGIREPRYGELEVNSVISSSTPSHSKSTAAAVLVLPDGAERYDSEQVNLFKEYAVANAHSWYKYFNGPGQRRRLHNGMLYLVTGYDKCHSWGSACYSHHIESGGASLKFLLGEARYKWERQTYSGVYQRSHQRDPTPGAAANQTVFLRGFSISVRVRTIFKSVSVVFIDGTMPPFGTEVPYSKSQLGIGPAVKRALKDFTRSLE
ncbi:hypothetical protein EV421DRAFT_1909835 [Armillaria borealis]|uniref:Uncharacterized protein n=1 Tax=Armillaria borealis TaxID=47425 RepID=A0AA39MGU3_9AGAR|nr:hypothetical protein EV421DRAFT_1909835 [Armillaria borealis]